MLNRWKKLSAGERLRTQLVIACLLLGMYGGVFYPISNGKLTNAENMLHRRQDRIEKRTGVGDLGSGGPVPQTIVKKIEEAEKQLQDVRAAFDELDTGFAPVDSSEVRQQLLLEISTLAERTGVELLSVAGKGFSPEKELSVPVVDAALGRPLLAVTAHTDFTRLLDFLHGLKDLSFYVSVMKLKVSSRHLQEERRGSSAYVPPGALFIALEMSI